MALPIEVRLFLVLFAALAVVHGVWTLFFTRSAVRLGRKIRQFPLIQSWPSKRQVEDVPPWERAMARASGVVSLIVALLMIVVARSG